MSVNGITNKMWISLGVVGIIVIVAFWVGVRVQITDRLTDDLSYVKGTQTRIEQRLQRIETDISLMKERVTILQNNLSITLDERRKLKGLDRRNPDE